MKFQGGQVKLTYNSNERRADFVKFNELIAGNWNFILLSSYCTDYEWLIRQFDGVSPETEINLIEHYNKNSAHAGIQRVSINNRPNLRPRTLNLIHPPFPKFPSYGVMHCKLIILASDGFMRIVVSSANLMDYDYDDVQNIVFVQDLPKLKESTLTASSASYLIDCQFYLALNKLLDILGVFNPQKVIMPMTLMQKYDWTGVKAKLVYSLPEYTRIEEENTSGIAMLNRIVKDHFIKSIDSGRITIEYQGSSVGTIKNDWLQEFGRAATGRLFEPNEVSNFIKKRVIDLTESGDEDEDKTEEDKIEFKLIFPTLRTVENSIGGPEAFGTLFCKKKDFESPSCPSEIFHDCLTVSDSEKCKYSMHSKIMTVSSENNVSYIYCGSHNFTASAWGKTTKQGSMLMINNFEVGVLIPASDWNCAYPYLRPAPKYKSNDLPWDQSDYYQLK